MVGLRAEIKLYAAIVCQPLTQLILMFFQNLECNLGSNPQKNLR